MRDKISRALLVFRLLTDRRLKSENKNIFFIVGSGRCGSTLLRVILERHPSISVVPEISVALPEVVDLFLNNKNEEYDYYIDRFFDIYSRQENWKNLGITKPDLVSNICKTGNPVPDFITSIYQSYSHMQGGSGILFGDKHPYLTFNIPYTHAIYPEAKYIHLVRDGRDVVASWNKSVGLGLSVEEASMRWNWALKEVERFKFLIKKNLFEVRYEHLVVSPEETLKSICDFLEVAYTEALFDLSFETTSDLNKDHHKGVSDKISSSSIGKWETLLSKQELKSMLPILERRLVRYGYI